MDIILVIIIILLPLIANAKVNSSYAKYKNVRNSANLRGKDVARTILDKHGLTDVRIGSIGGTLSDHYDPRSKTVVLSDPEGTSIASLAVAAHEVGHAIQHKESYSFLKFRTALVPIVNFTSRASTILLFLGLFLGALELFDIGIVLLLGGLLFQLVTLPVEFNASKRAKNELVACGIISDTDIKGTDVVLNAAAFTYVAAFLATTLQIVRLLAMRNRD